MKNITIALFAACAGLAMTATTASAEIVCNDEGDCWHVKTRHEYKPEFGVRIYADDWKWGDNESKKYRWREHDGDGRGYYRKGVWIDF
jgi:hypothetical protein